MKRTLKNFLSMCIIICLLITFTACGNSVKSETGITSLNSEDLAEEIFYAGVNHGSYELNVRCSKDYDENSLRAVIEDTSIIDVTYDYSDGLLFTGIKYYINCLKPGTTSFYFETIDSIIKSAPIEITVKENVTSITFRETEDITIYSWQDDENVFFDYESEHYISEIESAFSFISEDTNIVTFEYDEDAWFSDNAIITPVNPGETYIYIQTNDSSVKSQKVKVIVPEDEPEVDVENEEDDEPQDNSRTVYTTPYGEKYHYSQSCAGNNASPTTENSVKGIYDPCKKCAQ